jgi:hypothetical protein
MPKYLVEGRYTSDGLKGVAREGASRRRGDIETIARRAGHIPWRRFAPTTSAQHARAHQA